MLLAISTATVPKKIVLSENGILWPLRFAHSDITMHLPPGIIPFISSAKTGLPPGARMKSIPLSVCLE